MILIKNALLFRKITGLSGDDKKNCGIFTVIISIKCYLKINYLKTAIETENFIKRIHVETHRTLWRHLLLCFCVCVTINLNAHGNANVMMSSTSGSMPGVLPFGTQCSLSNVEVLHKKFISRGGCRVGGGLRWSNLKSIIRSNSGKGVEGR